MHTRFVPARAKIAAIALLSTLALAPTPATSGAVAQPPAALVWPLGLDGAAPRELYTSHGELVDFDDGSKAGHEGIDIAATPGERVFAVEAGTVVNVVRNEDPFDLYQSLIVSRGKDLQQGLLYMHLADVDVAVGDAVERDQLLGTVVRWSTSCGFDHLHLQLVRDEAEAAKGDGKTWSTSYVDDGDPLLLLPTCGDETAPTFVATTGPEGRESDLHFLQADPTQEFVPAAADGPVVIHGPTRIVARIQDRFEGDGPVYRTHPPPCDHPPPAVDLAPLRIELRIVLVALSGSSGGLSASPGQTVFFNAIDFSGPVNGTAIAAAYAPESVGTYTQRDQRFVLTHRPEEDCNLWEPPREGTYRVEVRALDANHNETRHNELVIVDFP